MRVYNAGMEKIEFGFNSSARTLKEGGYFSVEPGQSIEVPEGARDLINHPNSGPGLRGLMILDYGVDFEQARIDGLRNYIESKRVLHERIHQRQVELEQVGVKNYGTPREMLAVEKQIKEAELRLNELEQHGDTSSDGSEGQEELGRPDGIESPEVQPSSDL